MSSTLTASDHKSRLLMTEVIDLVEDKKWYKCDECDLKTHSWNYMVQHKRIRHTEEGLLHKCDKCNATFVFKWSLKTHIEDVHELVTKPCNLCNFITRNKRHMAYHLKTKHSDTLQMFKCEDCDYKCLNLNVLERHKYKQHTGAQLKCDYINCTFKANYKKALIKHKEHVHSVKFCNFCDFKIDGRIITKRGEVRREMRKHEQKEHDGMKFTCSQCEFSSISYIQLCVHRIKHHNEIISCNFCQTCISQESELKQHLKDKHQKLFFCNTCDYYDAKKYLIALHKHYQHSTFQSQKKGKGVKRTKQKHIENCLFCDFKCLGKGKLMSHNSIEHRKCDTCEFIAPKTKLFREHRYLKHGIKDLKCSDCDFSTISILDLDVHQSNDHGQILSCNQTDVCTFSNANEEEYLKHLQLVHNQIVFQCKQCDFRTTRRYLQRNHLLIEHKKIKPL